MRLLRTLVVVLAGAAVGCAALDKDPILGSNEFQPKRASTFGTG